MSAFHSGMNYWQKKDLSDRIHKKGKYAPLENSAIQTIAAPSEQKESNNQPKEKKTKTQSAKTPKWPTAEKLKELVWKKKAAQVAKELGVSARTLTRRCYKEGIELPPKEHWLPKKIIHKKSPEPPADCKNFLHPRTLEQNPNFDIPGRPLAKNWDDIYELVELSRAGKLYEIEDWIAMGRPIQAEPPTPKEYRKVKHQAPLYIAVEKGFYAIAELLLINGYDPHGDYYGVLKPAVANKDLDMINLLFRFGVEPNAVGFEDVCLTYQRDIMDRFIEAGADPCRDDGFAWALTYKIRPLLGFIKKNLKVIDGLQRRIDMALVHFVQDKNPKWISLIKWAGASPHAKVPQDIGGSCNEDPDSLTTAIQEAVYRGEPEILKMFKIDKIKDDLNELLYYASIDPNLAVYEQLLNEGADPNSESDEYSNPVESLVSHLSWTYESPWRTPSMITMCDTMKCLELILKQKGKWRPKDKDDIRNFRRYLLKIDSYKVSKIVEWFKDYDACSIEELKELTRTPSIKKHLNHNLRPRHRNY